MPPKRKLEVAVLNITTHPHSPERYLELFTDAFNLKHPVKYWSSERLLLGRHRPLNDRGEIEGVHGVLFKFVEINTAGSWLNLTQLEPVESQDGEPVIDFPEDMRPNCEMTHFIFFPRGHRMFLFTRHEKINFSVGYTARALATLFNSPALIEKYGEVTVTVESTDESLEQILRIPSLTKLLIYVTLPNPDDLPEETIQDAMERLRRQRAKKAKFEYGGKKDEGIQPDPETKGFMALAKSNGYVKAEGYVGEEKVKESTNKHPVSYKMYYHPTEDSPLQMLSSLAKEMIPRFTGRR